MSTKQKKVLIMGISGKDGFYLAEGLQHSYVEFCLDNES
jgi:hypothetical protein